MIESRLLQRFPGWTPETLYARDAEWVEEEIDIMDIEATVAAQRMRQAEQMGRTAHGR